MQKTSNVNVVEFRALPAPASLMLACPRTEAEVEFVARTRVKIQKIISGDDKRLLLVAGPCSIHDTAASTEYAQRLAALAREVSGRILVVMRVYFEKPRTTTGWKGLIMDPNLDGSHDIASGLRIARDFLHDMLALDLPTATELLDPITPQYIADLSCWSAIGARTTESQTHRQLASGLSMPIGFKNSTDGSVVAAVNAIKSAEGGQTFLGVDADGRASAVVTSGNRWCHVVLRGGAKGPNYSAEHVSRAGQALAKAGLRSAIMIDCSHDNSGKRHERQPEVLRDVMRQIAAGDTTIIGAMLESNLRAGNQPFPQPRENLKYGVSITDGCIDWATTETLVRELHAALAGRFVSSPG